MFESYLPRKRGKILGKEEKPSDVTTGQNIPEEHKGRAVSHPWGTVTPTETPPEKAFPGVKSPLHDWAKKLIRPRKK